MVFCKRIWLMIETSLTNHVILFTVCQFLLYQIKIFWTDEIKQINKTTGHKMMKFWLYFNTAHIICVLPIAEISHYDFFIFSAFFISLYYEIQHSFLWLTVIKLSCMIISSFQLTDRINTIGMPMVFHSFIHVGDYSSPWYLTLYTACIESFDLLNFI